MLLLSGCYAFTYTSAVARGFSLAQLLLLGGVALLLPGRRNWHFALAGALLGAATLTNYLAVFAGVACLVALALQSPRPCSAHELAALGPGQRVSATAMRRTLCAATGFLSFIPADLWWFLAQRGSRAGQFPPFAALPGMARLAGRTAGAVLGALPLYVDGMASPLLAAALGLLLAAFGLCIVLRWQRIGTPATRTLFALAAASTPVGLIVLGAVFDNTPIELRYLAFSMPFVALLLAGALGPRLLFVLFAVQAVSIAGLILAPQTMQPARAAARTAAEFVKDGIVLLPRGNDGVGVVGAFAIEAPPALPLLLIGGAETAAEIRVRVRSYRRVVLALLEQDTSSRAASDAMRQALTDPHWRLVAQRPNVAVYERIGDEE
jgi:hypothetical protein